MGKGAIYTKNARSDYKSVSVLRIVLNENRVICDVKDNDKVPNYDGYLDLINTKGDPQGKLEVQVKTLKKGYKKPTYSINRKLIEYVVNAAQLPFLLVAVDQENQKVFWEHLSIQRTKDLLINLDKSGNQSTTIYFDANNEVSQFAPYDRWEDLAVDYKRRIDDNENPEIFQIELEVDPKIHVVIQLEQLSNILYAELDFIPTHLLIQQYPFREKYNSRYNNFVLDTYNGNLRTFFEAIKITDQNGITILDKKFFRGLKNSKERISTVLKKFTSNLIYYISTPEHRDYIDMRCFDVTSCNCARCQIEKYSFETLDFSIEVKDTKIDELLNNAYGHYKMGHFKKTYLIYKEAIELARRENRSLTVYLIEYNLSHLASLIETNYYDDDESKVIAKELREIDISTSLCKTKNHFHREIQEWMLNDYYMKHFHTKICEIKQQLIDHYQSSINGGSGSNNYVNELINQYSQLHQFLQQNTIINDCYKTFHDIIEMVIEGLFASYSVEGDRSSKIDSLNDWLLSQIIKYGRTRSIRRLANRYKIKELHYENFNDDHESVKKQALRLFNQFEIASEKLQSFEEPNYNYFSNEYRRWLNNSLYVVGLVDFDKTFIIDFTNALIEYYKRDTHRLDTTEIVSFLVRKFHLFTPLQRKELLLMGIRDEQLMRSYFLNNFALLCEEENVTFKIAKKDLNLITSRPFNQLSNIVSLVHVHRCLSDAEQKKVIHDKIREELNDSFRLDIWNSSVLYNVIPFNENDLARAIEILTPRKDIPGKPGNPFGGSRYSGALDQFINVCYDREIDLSNSKFDGLRENSHYYQWLLNVDGFDYKNFESSWLKEYGTEPYMKRFSKSDVLKNHIETLLSNPKEKNKEALKGGFMDIYVLK